MQFALVPRKQSVIAEKVLECRRIKSRNSVGEEIKKCMYPDLWYGMMMGAYSRPEGIEPIVFFNLLAGAGGVT